MERIAGIKKPPLIGDVPNQSYLAFIDNIELDISDYVTKRSGDEIIEYKLTGDFLPYNVTFNTATGQFSGVPYDIGLFSYTVQCRDMTGWSNSESFSFQID